MASISGSVESLGGVSGSASEQATASRTKRDERMRKGSFSGIMGGWGVSQSAPRTGTGPRARSRNHVALQRAGVAAFETGGFAARLGTAPKLTQRKDAEG